MHYRTDLHRAVVIDAANQFYSQPRLLRWWRPVANVLFVCACSSAMAWIAFYGLSGGFR